MKHWMYVITAAGLLLGVGRTAWARQPVTQVKVTRPATQVTVQRPVTQVQVVRPTTQTAVVRPVTQTAVSRPVTQVAVERPVTPVGVFRPVTPAGGNGAPKAETKAPAPAVSSSGAKTSMSGYKPPVATDFKAQSAAKAGGGTAGLGNKINEGEKDAAAAARQAPAAQNPGNLSAQQIMSNSQAMPSNALQLLQQKAQQQQAAQKK